MWYAVIQGRFLWGYNQEMFHGHWYRDGVNVCVLPGLVFPSYTTEICDCPSVCIWYVSFHMILDFTFHATFGRVHINEAHNKHVFECRILPLMSKYYSSIWILLLDKHIHSPRSLGELCFSLWLLNLCCYCMVFQLHRFYTNENGGWPWKVISLYCLWSVLRHWINPHVQTGETMKIYRYIVSPTVHALRMSACMFGEPYFSHSTRKGRCMV
jgi:hypothetical protein